MTVAAPALAADLADWLKSLLAPGAALRSDSRAVSPGDAFLAYPGERADGRQFIAQAIERGAAAVVMERAAAPGPAVGVPHREVSGLKPLCGPVADIFHGRPSLRLQVLAVTGTNGKTSCSQWIAQGLTDMGRACAVVGTLGSGRPDALSDGGLTTPDALELQALFAGFAAEGIEAVAIEASSIGLDQHRLDGTRVSVAIHTNLTRDHLDYHGDMQAYAQAKARLFAWPGLQAAVVNLDDPSCATMLAALAPATPTIGYRITEPLSSGHSKSGGDIRRARSAASESVRVDRELLATSIEPMADGMRITLDGDWGPACIECKLIGRFNVSNLLAVAGAWLAMGCSLSAVTDGLQRLRAVPGRLQPVRPAGLRPDAVPLAVVDYAHTPDALDNALAALRPVAQARGGLLWCVLGAGGDRDPGKRPLMGAAALRGADRVVITSDNPRSEAPERILDAIAAGMDSPAAFREADRARAIATTIAMAGAPDVVLIAGKGHETYQEVAGVRHPFDDREQAARALADWALRREVSGV